MTNPTQHQNRQTKQAWRSLTRISLFAIVVLSFVLHALPTIAQQTQVRFTTTAGTIVIALYDDTPLHRDNFVKLVREGYYDGLIFHRVIPEFMVQTGDSATRHATPGTLYGDGDLGYTLPAEIRYPQHFHKAGAVAAAREGDDVNPEFRSSAAQFYIVIGRTYNAMQLDRMRKRVAEATQSNFEYPESVAETYYFKGGTPWLDKTYTVFGEVVEGFDEFSDLSPVPTDANNRPLEDVRIVKAEVIEK